MGDNDTEVVKQQENNKTGFQLHPENINREGRPKKGTTLTDIMRQIFQENAQIPKAIVAKLLEMAAKGDIAAIREVLDRVEGKAVQTTELTGENGQPILISASRGFIPPGTPITSTPDGSHAIEPGTVQDDSVAPKG